MAEQNASTNGYGALAWVYDRLNAEIDYGKWADFVEECFHRYSVEQPSLVLDLACGTGRMTAELARRGYDMIGIDGSDSMLSEVFCAPRVWVFCICVRICAPSSFTVRLEALPAASIP